jgi:hypothetical protein
MLSQIDLNTVKQTIISFDDSSKIKNYYALSSATDQPETLIYTNFETSNVVTRIYGLSVDFKVRGTKNGVLPQSIIQLHKYLTNLEFADAQKWEPNYTEVMIWPYEYAAGEPLHWPKDWPNLDSPNTLKRGDDAYSIFLPGTETNKLRDFRTKLKEKQAVEIGGKKWSVSCRPVFPSEPVWRKAFESK